MYKLQGPCCSACSTFYVRAFMNVTGHSANINKVVDLYNVVGGESCFLNTNKSLNFCKGLESKTNIITINTVVLFKYSWFTFGFVTIIMNNTFQDRVKSFFIPVISFIYKGGTAPPIPKFFMFCALSQNYQHLFVNFVYVSWVAGYIHECSYIVGTAKHLIVNCPRSSK